MALEPRYDRQVAPRPAAARPFASAESFGAGLGRAAEQLGGALHRRQLTDYTIERRATQDRELADGMHRFAAIRENMDGVSREARNNALPGAEGHAEGMAEAVEAHREDLLDGITEDSVRRRLDAQFTEYALRFKLAEADWAEVQRAEKVTSDFQQGR